MALRRVRRSTVVLGGKKGSWIPPMLATNIEKFEHKMLSLSDVAKVAGAVRIYNQSQQVAAAAQTQQQQQGGGGGGAVPPQRVSVGTQKNNKQVVVVGKSRPSRMSSRDARHGAARGQVDSMANLETVTGLLLPPYYVSPKYDGVRCTVSLSYLGKIKGTSSPPPRIKAQSEFSPTKTGTIVKFNDSTVSVDFRLRTGDPVLHLGAHARQLAVGFRKLMKRDAFSGVSAANLHLDGELCASSSAQQQRQGGSSSVNSGGEVNAKVDFDAIIRTLRLLSKPTLRHLQTANWKPSPAAIANAALMSYKVFDVIAFSTTTQTSLVIKGGKKKISVEKTFVAPGVTRFDKREKILTGLVRKHVIPSVTPTLSVVPHEVTLNPANIRGPNGVAAKMIRQHHVEGVVVRTAGNKYHPGGRPDSMLKVVPWSSAEFKVIDVVPNAARHGLLLGGRNCQQLATMLRVAGESNIGNRLGSMERPLKHIVLATKSGHTFKLPTVHVEQTVQARWLKDRSKLIGQMMTVEYHSANAKTGIPRHGKLKAMRGKTTI